MTIWTRADKHKHSVLDAARVLYGEATGTHGGTSGPDQEALASWLQWRLFSCWGPGFVGSRGYDEAVWNLGIQALRKWHDDRGAQ
jgi:hypothetical protein